MDILCIYIDDVYLLHPPGGGDARFVQRLVHQPHQVPEMAVEARQVRSALAVGVAAAVHIM